MGMSTNIIGFKPPDEKWQAMKRIHDACEQAGIDVPDEVDKFFEYEVEVAAIPKDVKFIRFYGW